VDECKHLPAMGAPKPAEIPAAEPAAMRPRRRRRSGSEAAAMAPAAEGQPHVIYHIIQRILNPRLLNYI